MWSDCRDFVLSSWTFLEFLMDLGQLVTVSKHLFSPAAPTYVLTLSNFTTNADSFNHWVLK